MSPFPELIVIKIGARLWKLYADYKYKDITVPKGFVTDFASVPSLFWIIVPPDGEYTAAAVVHDFLYCLQDRTRNEADNIFLEIMRELGVSAWKREVMWLAVRMFGWIPWNKKEKNCITVEI